MQLQINVRLLRIVAGHLNQFVFNTKWERERKRDGSWSTGLAEPRSSPKLRSNLLRTHCTRLSFSLAQAARKVTCSLSALPF